MFSRLAFIAFTESLLCVMPLKPPLTLLHVMARPPHLLKHTCPVIVQLAGFCSNFEPTQLLEAMGPPKQTWDGHPDHAVACWRLDDYTNTAIERDLGHTDADLVGSCLERQQGHLGDTHHVEVASSAQKRLMGFTWLVAPRRKDS